MNRAPRSAARAAAAARGTAALLLTMLLFALSGCSLSVPTDPDGTLERVRGGELRVGVTHNPPMTGVEAGAAPTGVEAELVRGFAESLSAEVIWVAGSEAALVQGLEDGTLDLAIGGFHDDSPWADKAGPTTAYAETQNPEGGTVKHIMLTPMGENSFLVELETYLSEATSKAGS